MWKWICRLILCRRTRIISLTPQISASLTSARSDSLFLPDTPLNQSTFRVTIDSAQPSTSSPSIECNRQECEFTIQIPLQEYPSDIQQVILLYLMDASSINIFYGVPSINLFRMMIKYTCLLDKFVEIHDSVESSRIISRFYDDELGKSILNSVWQEFIEMFMKKFPTSNMNYDYTRLDEGFITILSLFDDSTRSRQFLKWITLRYYIPMNQLSCFASNSNPTIFKLMLKQFKIEKIETRGVQSALLLAAYKHGNFENADIIRNHFYKERTSTFNICRVAIDSKSIPALHHACMWSFREDIRKYYKELTINFSSQDVEFDNELLKHY